MAAQISPASGLPLLISTAPAKPVPIRSSPVKGTSSRAQSAGSQDAAVVHVNQHLQQAQTDLRLQMDTGSGRVVFQVIQQGTGEVVLQVPSEEVLGMSRRLREIEGQAGVSGALVDKEG